MNKTPYTITVNLRCKGHGYRGQFHWFKYCKSVQISSDKNDIGYNGQNSLDPVFTVLESDFMICRELVLKLRIDLNSSVRRIVGNNGTTCVLA